MSQLANPRDVLRVARRDDWTPQRLVSDGFPTMSLATAGKLLAGSAVITEVLSDGKFTVYIPGVTTYPKLGPSNNAAPGSKE